MTEMLSDALWLTLLAVGVALGLAAVLVLLVLLFA